MPTRSYIDRNLEAWSQVFNALIGGNPDRTLSYTVGKLQYRNRWSGLILAPVINLMFRDKDHCLNAFKNNI